MKRVNSYLYRLVRHKPNDYKTFLTLTYDDDHLFDSSLNYRDLTLFFKKLRKAGLEFTYVASGEYGDTSARPHFHVLMFYKCYDGDIRNLIMSKWEFGHVYFGEVNEKSIRYVVTDIMVMESCIGKYRKATDKEKSLLGCSKVLEKHNGEVLRAPRLFYSKGIGLDYIITEDGSLTSEAQRHINNMEFGGHDIDYLQGRSKAMLPYYYKQKVLDEELRVAIGRKNKRYMMAQPANIRTSEQEKFMRQARDFRRSQKKLSKDLD